MLSWALRFKFLSKCTFELTTAYHGFGHALLGYGGLQLSQMPSASKNLASLEQIRDFRIFKPKKSN